MSSEMCVNSKDILRTVFMKTRECLKGFASDICVTRLERTEDLDRRNSLVRSDHTTTKNLITVYLPLVLHK